jgi:ABC-type uncharacterized transport system permease subunit
VSDEQLPGQGQATVNSETGEVEAVEPSQIPAAQSAPAQQQPESRWTGALRDIVSGSAVMSVLAVVLAMVVGAVLIALTDQNVHAASVYFFARPMDTLAAIWNAVSGAYISLFQGSVYNFNRPDFVDGIRPLTETLSFATPLVAAGLGVALGFRAGLFNIGGRGQMLFGAAAAGWVGFSFDLPPGIHLALALAAGIIAGGIWSGIAGLLKARTGAHEVIVTIMLNYIAFYLISYMLRTPGLLQAPGSNNPKSPSMHPNAIFPKLLGPQYNLTIGFLLVIVATIVVWWILNRSSLGFQFRAVGENPQAARVAGINVKNVYIITLVISGALIGMAGANQVQGVITSGFTSGIDAGIGFDAITVALLGRSRPWGTFWAAILFGAFKAGGFTMQAVEAIPIDIVLVLQSLIVLFIAAPPLVRTVFRLPKPREIPRLRRSAKASKKTRVVTK